MAKRKSSSLRDDDPILILLRDVRHVQSVMSEFEEEYERSGNAAARRKADELRRSLMPLARQLRSEVFALCQHCCS